MADAARLDPDQGLARARIGHEDRGDFDLGALSWGDDAPDFVCHPTIVPNRHAQGKGGAGRPRVATSVSRPMFRVPEPAIVS
jgi:hypothetical protein